MKKNKCLAVKFSGRILFTLEYNLPLLKEFARTYDAEILLVSTKNKINPSTIDGFVNSVNSGKSSENIEYSVIETKVFKGVKLFVDQDSKNIRQK